MNFSGITSAVAFNPTTSKYIINYDGKQIETTVTDKAFIADKWVRDINMLHAGKSTVVGLDVEWLPHPVRYMSNKSATLQLCINDKCLIVQLFYMDYLPISLKNFLMSSNFTFVGVEVAGDIAKLKDEYGLDCSSCADIRELAKRKWPGRFSRPGLKDLALEVVGLYMRKPMHVCKSNWQARVLSNEQVEYGCIDAYASYKIGHRLLMEG
ncbi:hypothetical protein RIF29_10394 [Crotalaria pallida]|uniref:3'-5' exonuclease domain-containing protein n=1 Tax=Crotalaria pallida TaxID=3830 RepID=A0AAN9FYW9_CROPI